VGKRRRGAQPLIKPGVENRTLLGRKAITLLPSEKEVLRVISEEEKKRERKDHRKSRKKKGRQARRGRRVNYPSKGIIENVTRS